MKLLSLILLVLTSAGSAHARLGEMKGHIEGRYGRPVSEKEQVSTYEKGPWRIVVQYIDGKSVSETYTKLEGGEVSPNEVNIILQKNGGSEWVLGTEKNRKRWQRGNGTWLAEYTGKTFRLWTKKQDDIESTRAAEREQKKIEDERKLLESF